MKTPTEPPPTAPEHLSERSRKLWQDVLMARQWHPAKLALLGQALESLDRADAAAAIVRTEGIVVTGGKMPHLHPAVKAEKDARTQFAALWRSLGCDRLIP